MARPRTATEERRDERLNLRLTMAERLTIEANAAFHGVAPSEYARRTVLARRMPPTQSDRQSTALLATAILRLGNNLNQLTHHANAGKGLLHDELLTLIARIHGELDRLYDPPADDRGRELQGGGPLLPR